jgi:hypothetical protein
MSLRQRNTPSSTLRRRILRVVVSVLVCLFIGVFVTLVFCAIPLRELGPRWQIPVVPTQRLRINYISPGEPLPGILIDGYSVCKDRSNEPDRGFAWTVDYYGRTTFQGRPSSMQWLPADLAPLPDELRTAIEKHIHIPRGVFSMRGSDLHLGYPSHAVAQTVWTLHVNGTKAPNLFVGRTPFGTIITSTDADSILKRSWRILPKPFLTNSLLFAAVPAFLLTAFHTFRFVRTRRRLSKNLCPHCTYPLTGLPPSAPCPECGGVIDGSTVSGSRSADAVDPKGVSSDP